MINNSTLYLQRIERYWFVNIVKIYIVNISPFKHTHTHTHTNIYIYMCVCVCVFVYTETDLDKMKHK